MTGDRPRGGLDLPVVVGIDGSPISEAALAFAFEAAAGRGCSTAGVRGDVLIEQATGSAAGLVVVASHGRGGAAGPVLGSVRHAVLHHSPRPGAVVRAEAER